MWLIFGLALVVGAVVLEAQSARADEGTTVKGRAWLYHLPGDPHIWVSVWDGGGPIKQVPTPFADEVVARNWIQSQGRYLIVPTQEFNTPPQWAPGHAP